MTSNQAQPHKTARTLAGVTQAQVAVRAARSIETIKRLEKRPPEKLAVEELDAYVALTGFTREQVLGEAPLPDAETTAGGAA
jgi:hypothetical protein